MVIGKKHAMKDMTFLEFKDRAADQPVILLPFGSQEQQGPCGPMGDYMLSERLAEMTAEAADALCAPTMPFGFAEVFRTFPGGIQVRAETFCHVLEDMALAMLNHGLERLVVFNGHTGNSGLIDQVAHKIRREKGVAIASLNIWKILPEEFWVSLHGPIGSKAGGHGGDPVLSVYHHLFPHLVTMAPPRSSRSSPILGLPPIGTSAVNFEGISVSLPITTDEVDPLGLIGGDPRLSNARIGAAITEHIVQVSARFVRHFRNTDPRNITVGPVTAQDGR